MHVFPWFSPRTQHVEHLALSMRCTRRKKEGRKEQVKPLRFKWGIAIKQAYFVISHIWLFKKNIHLINFHILKKDPLWPIASTTTSTKLLSKSNDRSFLFYFKNWQSNKLTFKPKKFKVSQFNNSTIWWYALFFYFFL